MTSATLTPEKIVEQTKLPPKYAVIFLNDDFTPMNFVTELLVGVFHHSEAKATEVMMEVHEKGKSVVGTYRRDIAETKADHVLLISREFGHPFKCVIEPLSE